MARQSSRSKDSVGRSDSDVESRLTETLIIPESEPGSPSFNDDIKFDFETEFYKSPVY